MSTARVDGLHVHRFEELLIGMASRANDLCVADMNGDNQVDLPPFVEQPATFP